MIRVFVDGSCTPEGRYKGLGACAFLIQAENIEMEDAIGFIATTNNRMEIEAVIKALTQIYETKHIFNKSETDVVVYSDSDLIVNTMKPEKPWKRKKNEDKWIEIDIITEKLKSINLRVCYIWIQAQHNSKEKHELAEGNKRVDRLARDAKEAVKREVDNFL